MPHDVGPLVTGLSAAVLIGVGLMFILCTGARREARRVAKAKAEAEQAAARSRALHEMAQVQARQIEAARQAALAALKIQESNAETVVFERIEWPTDDRDASIRVPKQTRPYARRPTPYPRTAPR